MLMEPTDTIPIYKFIQKNNISGSVMGYLVCIDRKWIFLIDYNQFFNKILSPNYRFMQIQSNIILDFHFMYVM